MENIKVSVKPNDWSEVFDMLVELGATALAQKDVYGVNEGWLFVHNNVVWIRVLDSHEKECREVVFKEFKDMVVLKRNDVNDRNVIDPEYTANLYLGSRGELFVFHVPTQTWKISNLNGEEEVMQRLKPIEKTAISNTEQAKGDIMKYKEVTGLEAFTAKMNGEDVEYKHVEGEWVGWSDTDAWDTTALKSPHFKFRIVTKQQTIVINGQEVDAPFKPKAWEEYWSMTSTGIRQFVWEGDKLDTNLLNTTGFYRTKEDAENALNAMCSTIQDYYKTL